MKKVLKKLTPFISIVFFGVALWFLDQKLQQYQLSEITAQLSEIPNLYVGLSLVLSFLSYLLLTGYDALGVDYIGEELAPGKIVRAGYVGYAFSHNIGLALITGGSIRYRIYSAWGFSGMQVTQIVAFSAFTLWIGFCAVAGLALLLATPNLPADVVVPFVSLRVLGLILLVMVVAYVWGSAVVKKELSFKKWSFKFPSLTLALKQVIIASVDWLLAASVLYVLLPEVGVSFFSFVGVFLLAQIIGLFSQVPGGLGVFESVMLLYLSNFMEGSQVLGILVVYRIIYYILPLLGALIVLGYQEYVVNRKKVHALKDKALDWVPRVVPQVMSFSIFIGGAILLFSGALPSEVPRMQWLQHFIPLPVIEMSHFFASLVGAALLVLAGALQRRIDGAYHATIGLLTFGIIFSILKGADYEEAIILAIMLVALVPCKTEFHRKAPLFSQSFSGRWFTLILMVLASAVWLGVFSYRHVEYQKELWWEFTLMGDAPRYLRATVAALGFAIIVGLVKLLRPRRQAFGKPDLEELEIAQQVLQNHGNAIANLALSGDKELVINEPENGFIMFTRESRSIIALGDPIGPQQEIEEMIWEFHEDCTNDDKWPVFYKVSSNYLEYYVDLGLTLFKIGEEALIPLADFDLDKRLEPPVQKNVESMEYAGYKFEVVGKRYLENNYDDFCTISKAYLNDKDREERGFSVGQFSKKYIQQFPIAIVKKDDELVGFANILSGANNEELAVDLLRYQPGIPISIIDFILVRTMFWGKENGYQYFNLGMAPLSGMDEHDYSPGWSKLAKFVYTYGENFYGFKRARTYKSKFNPEWEARFLVCPGGWALPRIISHLTNVVSSGYAHFIRNTPPDSK
ncbi:bifunctional lysylphosphatidylglycerol flippase/synthetase MprF [Fodinibius halophilus]|uniref:Phosphatidylglycerol lysyltransferase n=1 Tax=Fodinibius halophilus TaxID=1736908 RepID=A0A6M1T6G0_9BACT|nr:bifunctional lysylphosphatidylglycerol flippase/synthetase MprF [Fodinibius halophilus]NGP88885.1 bifunctional lysylphosphatidylglycerol flippase/synthetase MprF [Fodinibius halophilus]